MAEGKNKRNGTAVAPQVNVFSGGDANHRVETRRLTVFALFFGALGGRHESEIEIARLERLLVVAQHRIV